MTGAYNAATTLYLSSHHNGRLPGGGTVQAISYAQRRADDAYLSRALTGSSYGCFLPAEAGATITTTRVRGTRPGDD